MKAKCSEFSELAIKNLATLIAAELKARKEFDDAEEWGAYQEGEARG